MAIHIPPHLKATIQPPSKEISRERQLLAAAFTHNGGYCDFPVAFDVSLGSVSCEWNDIVASIREHDLCTADALEHQLTLNRIRAEPIRSHSMSARSRRCALASTTTSSRRCDRRSPRATD